MMKFNFSGMGGLGEFALVVWFIIAAMVVLVHLAFALAIWIDAGREMERGGTIFVGGLIWMIATLLGGVFVAALYWAMHHSTLRPEPKS